jgi:hypothetical protein
VARNATWPTLTDPTTRIAVTPKLRAPAEGLGIANRGRRHLGRIRLLRRAERLRTGVRAVRAFFLPFIVLRLRRRARAHASRAVVGISMTVTTIALNTAQPVDRIAHDERAIAHGARSRVVRERPRRRRLAVRGLERDRDLIASDSA